MTYRISTSAIIAVFITISVLIAGPVKSGEIADNNSKLASSTSLFEGTLIIKEGHGDILVRSENGNQRRLKVKQSTVITRNGKPATYKELHTRDQIRVKYNSKSVVIELQATGS
jgi:hypothetical protein